MIAAGVNALHGHLMPGSVAEAVGREVQNPLV
jgi:hypothetical protein